MKIKIVKGLVLVALLAAVTSAQAAVVQWIGTGDSAWTNSANWTGEVVPGAADHTIINNDTGPATIDSVVGDVNILTPGWNGPLGTLNIVDGGSITVSGAGTFTRLGHTAGALGTINMTGGYLETETLHVGFFGDGVVNLSGDSTMRVTVSLGMADEFALGGSGVITMADNAKFRYDGDFTTNGVADNILAQGWIVALNAGDMVSYSYDAGNDWTEFVVAPIPPLVIGDIALDLLPGTNALTLTWGTANDFYTYTVESKISLLDTSWSTNVTGIAGIAGGGDITITTAVDQVKSFYRVVGE